MRQKIPIFFSVIFILFVADRWLKSLALGGVTGQSPFGQFLLFKNYGIIFSWPLPNPAAIAVMLGALLVVTRLLMVSWRRHDLKRITATSLMMIGAISNIYDRLFFGFVIDWAYLGRWWPVFNLADVSIAVGLVVFLTSYRKPVS